MYEERDPRSSGRGRPVLAAFVTSLLTTTGVFTALTVADGRGLLAFLHPHQQGDVEVPSITGVTVDQARELLRPLTRGPGGEAPAPARAVVDAARAATRSGRARRQRRRPGAAGWLTRRA